MSPSEPKLDSCGCCSTEVPPPAVSNRAGLPAIAYRLGTQASFLRRMLAALSAQAIAGGPNQGARPLAALTTRSPEDAAIALLDAWATVADVLTFYQERIANEGYLRTATERRSVLELARAIAYELKPGVAASVDLAFSLIDAVGAPRTAIVPVGTKVQSIPEQGKLPQTFETIEEIEARVEWNTLRPQLTWPQTLKLESSRLYFQGTALNLKRGDLMLLVVDTGGGTVDTRSKRIRQVTVESSLQRTVVDFEGDQVPIPSPPPLVITQLARPILDRVTFNAANIHQQIVQQQWRESDLGAMISIQRWRAPDLVVAAPPASSPPPPLPTATTGVFAFRVRDGVFGHNAPHYNSLPKKDNLRSEGVGDSAPNNWDTAAGWPIWKDPTTTAPGSNYADADLYLERSEPGVTIDSWVVLERPTNQFTPARVSAASDASLKGFGMSGKATGVRLAKTDGVTPIDKPDDFLVRKTTVYAQSEPMTLAMLPIEDPVAKDSASLTLDSMVLGLQVGQRLALTGELQDTPGVNRQEVVVLSDIIHSGGYTTLFFQNKLQNAYVRETVTINANVARATHGETVANEVLGSGNGAQANQSFTLKKPPLTYVSAQTASGAESTLSLRVNGVLWRESPSLYGLGNRSQNYILRIDDDQTTTITFGDGLSGARLPSGVENVTAAYRSGIGSDGNVPAGSLSLLQNPPLGVRSVTNPLAASGAEDPEKLAQARNNAPRTVLTLDRIVSLKDFEDFTRTFAGIGKARAVVLWGRNAAHRVHITIAGAGGAAVAPESDLYQNLLAAIAGAHDFTETVDVQTYNPQFFSLSARLLIDPSLVAADVLAAVRTALETAFSFDERDFGQGVSASEVVAVMQGVNGVIASDLDRLFLVTDPAGPTQTAPAQFLEAAAPTWPDGGAIVPAQLLLINPIGIELSEMSQ